jgi:queuine/archaeosine tRNA-ribosyltransferase
MKNLRRIFTKKWHNKNVTQEEINKLRKEIEKKEINN